MGGKGRGREGTAGLRAKVSKGQENKRLGSGSREILALGVSARRGGHREKARRCGGLCRGGRGRGKMQKQKEEEEGEEGGRRGDKPLYTPSPDHPLPAEIMLPILVLAR